MPALNVGCGFSKISGAVNVDINELARPDLVMDMTVGWPFLKSSFDTIYMFHVLEHVPKRAHEFIIYEVNRVLKDGGYLYISYPEFKKCAMNWINNYKGKREFWEMTIFGRGISQYDRHAAAMDTNELKNLLLRNGFEIKKETEEVNEPYNTILIAVKSSVHTYEDTLRRLYGF